MKLFYDYFNLKIDDYYFGRSAARIAYKNFQNELNYEKNVKIKVENQLFLYHYLVIQYEKKRSALYLQKKDRNDELVYCSEPIRWGKGLNIYQKLDLALQEHEDTPKRKIRKNKVSKKKLFESSKK